jgi:DNA-binding transcriptional regulator PaaX
MERIGAIQQKILLLLLGGLALGCSRSPRQYFSVLKLASKEWEVLGRRGTNRSVQLLYEAKLVAEKRNSDGSISLVLTKEGRRRAAFFQQRTLHIKKPAKWDKKWRVILFDIPEKQRQLRDIFRHHLQKIGFKELQKSVFVFPYDCESELLSLVKLYDAEKYFRFILATDINDSKQLRKLFALT